MHLPQWSVDNKAPQLFPTDGSAVRRRSLVLRFDPCFGSTSVQFIRRIESQPDRNGCSLAAGTNLHVDLCELAFFQIGELLRFCVAHDLGLVGNNEKETLLVALERERSRRRIHRLNCPVKHKNLICTARRVCSSDEAQSENT